jgi:hypothetical protein
VPAAVREERTGEPTSDRDSAERSSSVERWLEGRWPRVHVCFAEVLLEGASSSDGRPLLRAVVQLGGLTPADVQVTARLAGDGSEPLPHEPLRLWSVQSHHNGAFVFEAATSAEVTPAMAAPDLLVTVAPAPTGPADVALPDLALADVTRLVASGEPADCASPARVAHDVRDVSDASRLHGDRAR